MAYIGLRHFVAAKYISAGNYGMGKIISKAIKVNIKTEVTDSKLSADDVIAESIKKFKGGTLAFTGDDISTENEKFLFGYSEGNIVDTELGSKEIISNKNDVQSFFGAGFCVPRIKNGVNTFVAIWLNKVQFSLPTLESETQGEEIKFNNPSVEGIILEDDNQNYKITAEFSTAAKAIAWLEGKANILAKTLSVVSTTASGNYTTAQSVTLATAEAGAEIYYTNNGTIPSKTNGTKYTTAIALSKPSNTCIKAIAVLTGKADSDILELHINIS